jgi:hypothetical protein
MPAFQELSVISRNQADWVWVPVFCKFRQT